MIQAQKELRKIASPDRAEVCMRFFKTGPGEYGEGDKFIGVAVPDIRKVSREHLDLSHRELTLLLKSPIHEDRTLAVLILVRNYEISESDARRREVVDFYLKNRKGINNWDLVDLSASKILGAHCLRTKDDAKIRAFAESPAHWERRIAMVATFAYIRGKKLKLCFDLAKVFLSDPEDLMHKATGWMLREAGKIDADALRSFIEKNGKRMPRTMLRYAIEKFDASERAHFLKSTLVKKTDT